MPTIPFTSVLLAGGQNANVLQGNQFEFIGTASAVQVYATTDPGGGVPEIEVFFGQELQMPQGQIGVSAAIGSTPQVPEDEKVNDVAAPGDRLVVRTVETGAALGVTIRGLVKITPLPMG